MPTVFVYTLLIVFMLLCFFCVMQVSPYGRNMYGTGNKNISVAYKALFALPLLAIAVTCGVRYDVGYDHLGYLNIYLYGYPWRQHEILYVVIQNAFSLCKLPYPLLFGFLALIESFFFFMAFRKEPKLLVWLAIYLFFDGLMGSWNNIIRASIAGCIWIYSIDYIVEKKPIPYFVFNAIATGFHSSAVLLFVAYPLFSQGRDLFKNVRLQYLLLLLAFFIRITFFRYSDQISRLTEIFSFISSRYESYVLSGLSADNVGHQNAGTSMAFYMVIIINVIIIAYSKKMHSYFNSKRFNVIYNIYFIGVLTFYMFPVGLYALTRPFRYFYFFRPIMLAYFSLYLYENRKRLREFWTLMLVVVSFTGIFYGSMLKGSTGGLSKYPTYIQHPETPLKPIYKPHSVFVN